MSQTSALGVTNTERASQESRVHDRRPDHPKLGTDHRTSHTTSRFKTRYGNPHTLHGTTQPRVPLAHTKQRHRRRNREYEKWVKRTCSTRVRQIDEPRNDNLQRHDKNHASTQNGRQSTHTVEQKQKSTFTGSRLEHTNRAPVWMTPHSGTWGTTNRRNHVYHYNGATLKGNTST